MLPRKITESSAQPAEENSVKRQEKDTCHTVLKVIKKISIEIILKENQ
jgi:hypothetical protein